MTFYLYDANTSDALQLTLQNPQGHLKGYKLTPPPCLRFSLSSMKKRTRRNAKGKGEPRAPKREGEGGEKKNTYFFLGKEK